MKQKGVLITLIVCTLIVCLFFIVFIIKDYQQKNPTQSDITTKATTVTGYFLGEYNGKLATYKAGSDTPMEIFDVYVNSLPLDDREEIEKRLYARDENELQSLVEDFTS